MQELGPELKVVAFPDDEAFENVDIPVGASWPHEHISPECAQAGLRRMPRRSRCRHDQSMSYPLVSQYRASAVKVKIGVPVTARGSR